MMPPPFFGHRKYQGTKQGGSERELSRNKATPRVALQSVHALSSRLSDAKASPSARFLA